jgi:tetratricopeptide (TPR) repeat protein
LGEESGNLDAVACAAMVLGQIAMSQGKYPAAQGFYEKTLKLAREIETSPLISYALSILGAVLDIQGHYDQARTSYAEAIEIFQKRGNELWAAWPLSGLGWVALHQHDWQAAHIYFAESLNVFQKYADQVGIAACLIGLAGVAEERGQREQAAHVLGAIEEVRPKIAGMFYTEDIAVQSEYERIMAAVRVALGEEAFAAAIAKGREMTLEQAMTYVLEKITIMADPLEIPSQGNSR